MEINWESIFNIIAVGFLIGFSAMAGVNLFKFLESIVLLVI